MAGSRAKREKKESNTPLLLFLLVVLVGLSAWNYQRNAARETSTPPGPYATVSAHDLDVLIAAYRSEVDALRAQGGSGHRASPHETARIDTGIHEFERVQRVSQSAREAGYAISERQGAIEALEQEKARRAAQSGGKLMLFLRRAFTVSL